MTNDKTAQEEKSTLLDNGSDASRARRGLFDSLFLSLNKQNGNLLPPAINSQYMPLKFPGVDIVSLLKNKEIDKEELFSAIDPGVINKQLEKTGAEKPGESIRSVISTVSALFRS